MLHQYLQAEVVNSKAATDVLIFMNARLREMIVEALNSMNEKYEPDEEDQPLLKNDVDTIRSIELENGEYVVYFLRENETRVRVRPLKHELWYTEDLLTLLDAITQNDERMNDEADDVCGTIYGGE